MQFFKKVLSIRKDNYKEHEVITANLKQNSRGENRVTIEWTMYGPRGGKSFNQCIDLTPEQIYAIVEALQRHHHELRFNELNPTPATPGAPS